MTTTGNYSDARARLAELWDEAQSTREPILLRRRGKEDMALIAADELAGMLETMHSLRSPANAKRLLAALDRVRSGKPTLSLTVDELRTRVGLVDAEDSAGE